ncbi:MAG: FAD-dependent oxidoreductase [Burkholderiaceae bacterium]
MSQSLRVAVVGAGPSGFYAAQALTRQLDSVHVDLFERLPAPYGLVRYGVAPDHPKLKIVTAVFDKIAGYDQVRFIGNVELGRDLSLDELRQHYHAVIIATGTAIGNKPGIAGDSLPGSVSAAEFVGWFNGHPDHQHHRFDFSGEHAAVIGNGNVALDVARILLRSVEELRTTDITKNALDCLQDSQITDVHIIGRRGPVQVSFGKKELREFEELNGVQCIVDPADLTLNTELQATLDTAPDRRANYDTLSRFADPAKNQGAARRCHFHFYQSTVELLGNDHVETLVRKSNLDGRADPAPISCRLAVFGIGYRGESISQLEVNAKTGVIDNDSGRVLINGKTLAGVYVSGWIKRGPTGLIGTNRADSVATVETLISDMANLPNPQTNQDILQVLAEREHQTVDFDGWNRINRVEQEGGAQRDAPAEKITDINTMLALAAGGGG